MRGNDSYFISIVIYDMQLLNFFTRMLDCNSTMLDCNEIFFITSFCYYM